MRKALTLTALALVAGLALVQLVPVDRTNPPVERDIFIAPELEALLRRACYDCHSNETVWPWYGYVAPVSWLVARDIEEGRKHLNFSTWDRYADPKRRRKLLKDTEDEIEDGEMPPRNYLAMHPEARLSKEERRLLRRWAERAAEIAHRQR